MSFNITENIFLADNLISFLKARLGLIKPKNSGLNIYSFFVNSFLLERRHKVRL